VVSKVNEDVDPASDPSQYVLELSQRKAWDVARRMEQGIVLGADTVVVLDGQILGKPKDSQDAKRMLSQLSGKVHQVLTGLTLVDAETERSLSQVVTTQVKMRELSEKAIEQYVATGEPLDKAGGYAIQGRGAVLVEQVEGCFYNVVGLPLAKLAQMLEKMCLNPR
jgi:septum formation protein